MSDIKFYIPKNETIPTGLRLYVGDVYVEYERISGGFRFYISIDDEERALEIARKIVEQLKRDHDESEHGVSWRDVSLTVIPQEEWYKVGTYIEWKFRVRDSY